MGDGCARCARAVKSMDSGVRGAREKPFSLGPGRTQSPNPVRYVHSHRCLHVGLRTTVGSRRVWPHDGSNFCAHFLLLLFHYGNSIELSNTLPYKSQMQKRTACCRGLARSFTPHTNWTRTSYTPEEALRHALLEKTKPQATSDQPVLPPFCQL